MLNQTTVTEEVAIASAALGLALVGVIVDARVEAVRTKNVILAFNARKEVSFKRSIERLKKEERQVQA